MINRQSSTGALCLTSAAECLSHRNPHTPLFSAANKAQRETCFVTPAAASQTYPPSDASPACSANKVRPLHDKVQSRIIKLEKDRGTERQWHRHQTERKGLVRGRTQRRGSAANFWICALKKTVPISLPTHTHTPPPPPPPLWCTRRDEKKRRRDRDGFLIFADCWHHESACLCGPCNNWARLKQTCFSVSVGKKRRQPQSFKMLVLERHGSVFLGREQPLGPLYHLFIIRSLFG